MVCRGMSNTKRGIQRRLEDELRRLQRILTIGYNLRIRWLPRDPSTLSGEVKSEIIYIYEKDEYEAIKTLRHEIVDYCVSQAIEPYKDIANDMIRRKNEDAYKRKEKVVEALIRLIE
jgi:hypothetical protein